MNVLSRTQVPGISQRAWQRRGKYTSNLLVLALSWSFLIDCMWSQYPHPGALAAGVTGIQTAGNPGQPIYIGGKPQFGAQETAFDGTFASDLPLRVMDGPTYSDKIACGYRSHCWAGCLSLRDEHWASPVLLSARPVGPADGC